MGWPNAYAKTNNSLVIANSDPEENERFVNEMVILCLIGGKDSIISYYQQILSIASQCPYKGGTAVYKARPLVELFNDSIEFDDDNICSQQGYYRHSNVTAKNKNCSVNIIPNPAQDEATIIINGESEGICSVKILNSVGQNVLSVKYNCKEKSHKLNLKDLKPGIYFIKTLVSQRFSFVNKITIIK